MRLSAMGLFTTNNFQKKPFVLGSLKGSVNYWCLFMLSAKKLPRIFLFILLGLFANMAFAQTQAPIVINAIVTENSIIFSPQSISENTPFVIHIINQAGAPVELENTDTSVEIYSGMDKTFKVGLMSGQYVFFNDFNAHTKTAFLMVKPTDATTQSAKILPETQSSPTHLNTTSILFIIWRESVEALLVVGVVYSWLMLDKKEQRRSGLLFLSIGVMIGVLCAVMISFLLTTFNQILSPDSADIFQGTMTFVAVGMIVYMVKWMRTNGRTLKSNMHQSLEKKPSTRMRNISILTLAAIAVAREASEASIFIYALDFGNQTLSTLKMMGICGLGLLLAIATVGLLQLGNKIFSWRFFFKVTEILLLLLGGGLLLNAIDRFILSGILSPLHHKVWDTSFLISDGGFFAPLLSSFMGYRATPSLMSVIAYGGYWLGIYFLMRKRSSAHAR